MSPMIEKLLFEKIVDKFDLSDGIDISRLCQLLNKIAEKKSAESKEISINSLLF